MRSNIRKSTCVAMMEDLLSTARLPRRWYKAFADNYYNSEAIVEHLAATYSICMSGTLQRSNATPLVRIGTAPCPTIANPKGWQRKLVLMCISTCGWTPP